MPKTAISVLIALLISFTAAQAAGPDLSGPVILVAKPELRDPVFGATVLVVNPIGDDQHAGFIINRPSDVTLGAVFPGQAAKESISNPIYAGGPILTEVIFALVAQDSKPGGSIRLMDGLYAVYEEPVLDGLVAANSKSARFVSGFVAWRPGELRQEIEAGAWYVMAPDADVVARSPEHI